MNNTLDGRTVLVTGANGGLGGEFVRQALERGARKVYAAARSPKHWDDPRVDALTLDITDAASVARAVEAAPDVDLVVNNAGIAPAGDFISGPEDQLRLIFETNFFGNLRVANGFAPVLGKNGGGSLLNVLSVASWSNMPTGYAVSKGAMWSATNALRFALGSQNTQVTGLLVGMIDTQMTADIDAPKSSPATVAALAYDGIAAGQLEILADDFTRAVKAQLSTPGDELYPWMDSLLAGMSL